MIKIKLNLIRCPKCGERTSVLKDFKSTFLGVRFTTTWYKCISCNYTFPKKIKPDPPNKKVNHLAEKLI